MQIVVFKLGEEKYAIDTSVVQGIDKMMDIAMVPNAKKEIRGLVNLRGSIISVYDLYSILGVDTLRRESENILIVETENEIIGIIVDKVIEVIDINNDIIKDVSVSKSDIKGYIKGTINLNDTIVTLIGIAELLNAA